MSSSGMADIMQSKMAMVHNLLAPLTERFNLRIRAPPRTVPSTASGMLTAPGMNEAEGQKLQRLSPQPLTSCDFSLIHRLSPIIMVEKEMVWLNCLSMNLAMKVARPASSAARFTCARTTSR